MPAAEISMGQCITGKSFVVRDGPSGLLTMKDGWLSAL
jgi:hypothetical protein